MFCFSLIFIESRVIFVVFTFHYCILYLCHSLLCTHCHWNIVHRRVIHILRYRRAVSQLCLLRFSTWLSKFSLILLFIIIYLFIIVSFILEGISEHILWTCFCVSFCDDRKETELDRLLL